MPTMPMDGAGQLQPPSPVGRQITPEIASAAINLLRSPQERAGQSQFGQASSPINLLASGSQPPTVPGIRPGGGPGVPMKTTNLRGHNRVGGKVNTNISTSGNSSTESNLMNRVFNIQR